jgi:hypothetical protein
VIKFSTEGKESGLEIPLNNTSGRTTKAAEKCDWKMLNIRRGCEEAK